MSTRSKAKVKAVREIWKAICDAGPGWSSKEVAQRSGYSPSYVRTICTEYGFKRRSEIALDASDPAARIIMHTAGLGAYERIRNVSAEAVAIDEVLLALVSVSQAVTANARTKQPQLAELKFGGEAIKILSEAHATLNDTILATAQARSDLAAASADANTQDEIVPFSKTEDGSQVEARH